MNNNLKDWDNYWLGRTAETTGSALVGVENNNDIRDFWVSGLGDFPVQANVLDLACGAGTVAKILSELSFAYISGVDISEGAISILKERLPGVRGVVAPLEALPFENSGFDLIVSQYGFEYGDHTKVPGEIARILKPSGVFIALAHKSGGAIHSEVSEKSAVMTEIKKSDYLNAARDMFRASFSKLTSEQIRLVATHFRDKRIKVEGLAGSTDGFSRYLLDGTQDLFQRRAELGLEAMLGWLNEMEHEMDRFIGRMISMDKAALTEDRLSEIENNFNSLGMLPKARQVLTDGRGNELGWIIYARKQTLE